jgi:hypothetical protein
MCAETIEKIETKKKVQNLADIIGVKNIHLIPLAITKKELELCDIPDVARRLTDAYEKLDKELLTLGAIIGADKSWIKVGELSRILSEIMNKRWQESVNEKIIF